MGITILSLQSMLMPLQSLVAWLAGASAEVNGATAHRPVPAEVRRACCAPAAPARGHRAHPGRPLRVVRVLDKHHAARGAGRMVISGRMADVCAELERLAALESAAG